MATDGPTSWERPFNRTDVDENRKARKDVDEKRMGGDEPSARTSDTNTDSDRVLVTKRAIFSALRDLVAEHGFGNVSASDIIARAGVSRSTFYRCFTDKFDVANWAYMRFKNIRLQDRDKYYSFQTSLLAQLEHLYENRDFFASALRNREKGSLHDAMVAINEEYMVQCWQAAHGDAPSPAQRAVIRFAAAGCSYVQECWILEGCNQNPADIAETICTCIPPAVLETLY